MINAELYYHAQLNTPIFAVARIKSNLSNYERTRDEMGKRRRQLKMYRHKDAQALSHKAPHKNRYTRTKSKVRPQYVPNP